MTAEARKAARAEFFRTRRQFRPPYRFVGRFTSTDGIDFYEWERPIPGGDSRVDRVTCVASWFWGAPTTFWKGSK